MNLKYYLDKEGRKIYTLKETKETKDAHYKFIKFKDVKEHDNH